MFTIYHESCIFTTMNISATKMMRVAGVACDLLKLLANPHRLVMLCQLIDGEKTVGTLAAFAGIRDSTASQNLSLLRKAGIVAARRDGQTMWYSVQDENVRLILQSLYVAYCAADAACIPAGKPAKGKRK